MKELYKKDTLTQLVHMKLATALRKCLNYDSKLIIVVIRQMKNGALNVVYTIRGGKCSTFVSYAKYAKALEEATAQIARPAIDYAKAFINYYYSSAVGSVFTVEQVNDSLHPHLLIRMVGNSLGVYKIGTNYNCKWTICNARGQSYGNYYGYDDLADIVKTQLLGVAV